MADSPILFLKARARGDTQTGDLFDTPVQVAGYTTKQGTYVAPHQSMRRKRPQAPDARKKDGAVIGDLFGKIYEQEERRQGKPAPKSESAPKNFAKPAPEHNRREFTPTHTTSDGEPVRPYVEDGVPQPDTWENAAGEIIEDAHSTPLQAAADRDIRGRSDADRARQPARRSSKQEVAASPSPGPERDANASPAEGPRALLPVVAARTDAAPAADEAADEEAEKAIAARVARAAKLRLNADKLIAKADEELGRDRLANTHRRASMAASSIADAEKRRAMGLTMRNLADAIESGEAKHLDKVTARTHVETLDRILKQAMFDRDRGLTYAEQQSRQGRPPEPDDVRQAEFPRPILWGSMAVSYANDLTGVKGGSKYAAMLRRRCVGDDDRIYLNPEDAKAIVKLMRGPDTMTPWHLDEAVTRINRLERIGVTDTRSLQQALTEYVLFREGARRRDPVKEAERALIGTKIPGYFPTPKRIVSQMVGAAGIEPGMKVLEPSAGKGNIADGVREAGVAPDVLEVNTTLRGLLEAKGYNLVGDDFMAVEPRPAYDAVVMNPPFEHGQDIEHVRHAWDFVKPGGRLVAIMSEGAFFRQGRKEKEFREWLESLEGESEQLPDGAFMESERQTGVNTRMVTITKPAQTAEKERAALEVEHAEDKYDLAEALRDKPTAPETRDLLRRVAETEKTLADGGPKEGDTKTENGVTYVLRDGRWHRDGERMKNYGWDSVKLADAYTLEELSALREHVEQEHANPRDENGHPLENGQSTIYLYDKKGRKKLDALSWAVYHKTKTAKPDSQEDAGEKRSALKAKVEELGGRAAVAEIFKRASRDERYRATAESLVERLREATGLSRDQVLGELGLRERSVTSKPKGKPAPKTDGSDLDPNSANYRYRDTGYIPGSRKEDAANAIKAAGARGEQQTHTSIRWEELEANPRQAKEVITKNNLFGTVDWEGLKAGGMEPGAGFLISKIYAAIAKEPGEDSPQARQDYTLGLETLRDRLEKCRTPADVTRVLDELREEFEGAILTQPETERVNEIDALRQGLFDRVRQFRDREAELTAPWHASNSEVGSLKWQQDKRLRRGWKPDPKIDEQIQAAERRGQEAWDALMAFDAEHPDLVSVQGWSEVDNQLAALRDEHALIVARAKLRNQEENPLHRAWNIMGDRFIGVLKYRSYKGSDAFTSHVADAKAGRIADWSWLEKPKKTGPKATKESVRFQLKVADTYERVGGRDMRADSTATLKAMFGLRDVQSGNWVLRDVNAAKFHVEQCSAAFADLADLLGVPDEFVSMSGRLAMAFGARGQGAKGWADSAARAHYEPIHRVINLTKMGGGGALAHEWFHTLDNLIKEAAGDGEAGKDDFVTENPALLSDPELRDAVRALANAMTDGPHRLEGKVTYSERDYRLARHNIDRPRNAVSRGIKEAADLDAALVHVDAHYVGRSDRKSVRMHQQWRTLAIAYHDGKPEGGKARVSVGAPTSAFAVEAVVLDNGEHGKNWSKGRELAARAFQSWCEDRLAEQGRRNDYLSSYADNKYHFDPILGIQWRPYPEGEERARINQAFDRLFAVLREKREMLKAFAGYHQNLRSFYSRLSYGAIQTTDAVS